MFNKTLATKLTLLLVLGAVADDALAQRGGGGRNRRPEPKGDYVVVQVEDRVSIVRKSEVAWLKGEIGRRYQQSVKQFTEAKKDAAKNKIDFTEKKPTKSKLKVLKKAKTEEAARKHLDSVLTRNKKGKSKKKTTLKEADALGETARGRGAAGRGGAGRGRGGAGRGGAGGGKGDDGKGKGDDGKGKRKPPKDGEGKDRR